MGDPVRVGEWVATLKTYGVGVPRHWRTMFDVHYYDEFIDFGPPPGSGHVRVYTTRQVRRMVSWLLVNQVTGNDGHGGSRGVGIDQRRQAMRLLSAAREGWVVLADGRAIWSLVPPVATLRTRCAIAIPVPEWRDHD